MAPDRVRRALRLLVGGTVLVALGFRLGTGPFLAALDVVAGLPLAAAVGIGALTTLASAWRWSLVARGLGLELPMGPAVLAYYRSLFLNAVLPGGVLGDVHRAVRHGRDVGDGGTAARAVVLERTAGQIVLLAIAAATVAASTAAIGIAVLLVAAAALAVLPATRPWLADARRTLGTRPGGPRVLAASAVVLAGHVATFVLAARAAGVVAGVGVLVPLAVTALVAMSVPLNVAGWGPREGATAWAFAASGLGAEQGLTVSIVYGLFALAAALPGAAILVAGLALRSRTEPDGSAVRPQRRSAHVGTAVRVSS